LTNPEKTNSREEPTVEIADVTSAPGTVLVPVEMTNFTQNINSLTLRIYTDKNLVPFIELVNIDPGFQGFWQTFQSDTVLTLSWFDFGAGYLPDGEVFEMKFTYYGGFDAELIFADGSEVTYGSTPIDNIVYIDGSINQVAAAGELSMDNVTVQQGSSFQMPLIIEGSGYNSVTEIFLRTGYDTTQLQYEGYSVAALSNVLVTAVQGVIQVEWSDSGNPLNFTAPDTLLYLEFTFQGNTQTTIQYLPGSRVYNNGMVVPSEFTDGPVSVLYLLQLLSEPPEGGTVNGSGYYLPGEQVVVSAEENSGYDFVNWTQNGTVISTDNSFSYTMPAGNDTLVANFILTDYSLSLIVFPEGGGMVSGGGIYNLGDTVTVNALPNPGYAFEFWTVEGNIVSFDPEYEFIMPAENIEMTANFSLVDYTVEAYSNNSSLGSVTGGGVFNYGDTATLTAIPEPGSLFIAWTENGSPVSYDTVYEFIVESDRTLVGNFQVDTECPEPIGLYVDEIGENSAILHWLPTGDESEWEVLWGFEGFDTISEGTLIQGLTENMVALEDLEQGTFYDFYTRAVCLDTVKSQWAGPLTFSTLFVRLADREAKDSFRVFPNPASEIVYIRFPDNRPRSVVLINSQGMELVRKDQITDSEYIVEVSSYPGGLYFIAVHTEKRTFYEKLLIR
jgi:hypothetical protein